MNNKTFDVEVIKYYKGVQIPIKEFIQKVNENTYSKSTLFIIKGCEPKMYKNNIALLEDIKNKSPTYKILVLIPNKNKHKVITILNDNPKQMALELTKETNKEVGRKHLQNIKNILAK